MSVQLAVANPLSLSTEQAEATPAIDVAAGKRLVVHIDGTGGTLGDSRVVLERRVDASMPWVGYSPAREITTTGLHTFDVTADREVRLRSVP